MPIGRGRALVGMLSLALSSLGYLHAQEPLTSAAPSNIPEPGPPTEIDLRNEVRRVEAEQGPVARALIDPLFALGRLYADTGRCADAVPAIGHALELSRRHDGFDNPEQRSLLAPLLECYVRLDAQADLERELEQQLRLDEARFGKNDARMLPTLETTARWYEEAGRYLTARSLHTRAIKLIENSSPRKRDRETPEDPRLVGPLRGIARAFRLEYQFGLQGADVEQERYSALRSRAELEGPWRRLDDLGERSLTRAASIVRKHPDVRSQDRIDTLVDLGDWYQMADAHRAAVTSYREAWQLLNVADDPQDARAELFSEPVPILYRSQLGTALRRSPPEADARELKQYIVALDYTVTAEGSIADIKVIESNAPKHLNWRAAEDLQRLRYRPRFEDGEPVATRLHHRQKLYVAP